MIRGFFTYYVQSIYYFSGVLLFSERFNRILILTLIMEGQNDGDNDKAQAY